MIDQTSRAASAPDELDAEGRRELAAEMAKFRPATPAEIAEIQARLAARKPVTIVRIAHTIDPDEDLGYKGPQVDDPSVAGEETCDAADEILRRAGKDPQQVSEAEYLVALELAQRVFRLKRDRSDPRTRHYFARRRAPLPRLLRRVALRRQAHRRRRTSTRAPAAGASSSSEGDGPGGRRRSLTRRPR